MTCLQCPKETQAEQEYLRRVLDKTLGSTIKTIEYVHSAAEFADFFANKIASIRQEPANAAPPACSAVPAAILSKFLDVTSTHVTRLISAAPCKHSEADPLPTWFLKKR
jgi:hypothetical protein